MTASRWLATGLACLALACGDSRARPGAPRRPEQRLLVVGWDGASFDLVDPLVAAGKLPTVARLLRAGRSARLESTVVPISSSAWVGAVTGMGPGETGVYSFFEPIEGSYDVRLISSRSNHALPLWRILGARGLRMNIFGVPVTYPPEPLRGTLVAGMLSPFDADYAWPAEYTRALRATGFVPDLGIWREEQVLTMEGIERQLELKEAALQALLEKPDWDFSMVVFKSLDVLSHRLYDGRSDTQVAQLCERLDAILGRLIVAAGPDTNVLLLSDHGFAAYPFQFNLHSWLIEAGWSIEREARGAQAAPEGPLALARAAEERRRIDELDLDRTRAFATTSEGNFGGIRLNLAGREARGVVTREGQETSLAALEAGLRALQAPGGEGSLITQVWRGAELYPGPWSQRVVPDLLFEVDPRVHVVSTTRGAVFQQHERAWSDHAREGIWILAGPGILGEPTRGRVSILDLAPTVLNLLNQPAYLEMRGRSRGEGLRSAARLPAAISLEADRALETLEALDPFDPKTQAEVESRLRGLGYVD